ncbi:MAG: hypothetical protein ACUVRK_13305 [Spirochaetota bacterium]
MKNAILLFVCALAIATAISCGDKSSDSSSTEFKIKPGDVSPITPNLTGKGTSFNVTFGSNTYNPSTTDDYAIIISNVNNTGNVGIAFGTDPKTNRSFKVFIYYAGDISTGNKPGTVTVIENGITYTASFSGINFGFIGPDGNNVYTITINDITVSGKPLQFNELKTYRVQ